MRGRLALLLLLALPSSAPDAQVTPPPATTSGTVRLPTPSGPIATAALPTLQVLALPKTAYLDLGGDANVLLGKMMKPAHLYWDERDGRAALVFEALGMETVFPPGSQVLYAGPFAIQNVDGPKFYRVYVLRPVGASATAQARPAARAAAALGTRTALAARPPGGAPATDGRMTTWTARPGRPDCGLAPDAGAKGHDVLAKWSGGALTGLTCALLEDGQSLPLADGLTLLRLGPTLMLRNQSELVETLGPVTHLLVVRDAAQRVSVIQSVGVL